MLQGGVLTKAISVIDKDQDMTFKRQVNLQNAINKAFQSYDSYEEIAMSIYHAIKGNACTGNWLVFASRYGILTDLDQICGSFDHWRSTKLLVRFRQTSRH